ncbi:MAG: radical SAM family heme chaperone HemW [Proteobacteria bacterium]|jgi:putative oxygen-independent coproporphyrinogen III oxidase|nr:radical SAM family heme chaperone HemW [Pseudomonadota bacterium]MCG6934542.1 radical SAM family heme chaperone HemW [Pseudomonadota bacterium]
MPHFSALPPLSLYIHFPWCVRKCPYCDFNSHELRGALDENRYVDALLADLDQELPRIWGRSVGSIFMGGGTPSLFGPAAIDRLLSGVRARLPLNGKVEITLEANPGTTEQDRFTEYRAIGVNRLSIGIQSFQDHQLQQLGRIHDRREAIRAAEMAHAAGFDNFNLDLMFALPGQTVAAANQDLATAMALDPAHISWYQLTIEPNTQFHHRPPALPDEDLTWAIQHEGQSRLAAAGYTQYEVSAYARTGRQCRHNLNYWQFGDYVGIGAGAHDKISDHLQQRIERRWKVKHPQTYLDGVNSGQHIAGNRHLDEAEIVLEFMMNALRLNAGFDEGMFVHHTGLSGDALAIHLAPALQRGWLEQDKTTVRATSTGRHFLDDLACLFLPDDK